MQNECLNITIVVQRIKMNNKIIKLMRNNSSQLQYTCFTRLIKKKLTLHDRVCYSSVLIF